MKILKQNNLESGTTELGFVRAINENSGAETTALIREAELDSGEKVQIEGITPHGMKKLLTQSGAKVEFITPGEKYIDSENNELSGIAQKYNKEVTNNELEFMHMSIQLFEAGFDYNDAEVSYSKIQSTNPEYMIGGIIFNSKFNSDITVEILERDIDNDWHISNRIYAKYLQTTEETIPLNHIYEVHVYDKNTSLDVKLDCQFKVHVYDSYNSIESGILSVVGYPLDS